jgi:hypothetical protein
MARSISAVRPWACNPPLSRGNGLQAREYRTEYFGGAEAAVQQDEWSSSAVDLVELKPIHRSISGFWEGRCASAGRDGGGRGGEKTSSQQHSFFSFC